jgi:hypothetical protein
VKRESSKFETNKNKRKEKKPVKVGKNGNMFFLERNNKKKDKFNRE